METATAAQHQSVSSWLCMLKVPASPLAFTPTGGLTAISCAFESAGGSEAWPEQPPITMGPMITGQPGRDPPDPGPPPPVLFEGLAGELPPSPPRGPPPPVLLEGLAGELPPWPL